MLEDVAGVRGLAPPPSLKAGLVARKDLPALLDRTLTDDDRERYRQATVLYRLLGHLGPGQDLKAVFEEFGQGAIIGLYSPQDDELWVVGDGDQLDIDDLGRQEKSTLAHELVHALQDYHFDLEARYQEVADDLDRGLAWSAVVEGDAQVHEGLYADRYLALPVGAGAGGGPVMLLMDAAKVAASTPPSLVREFLFPYQAGADAMRTVREREGSEGIDRLVRDLPPGTAAILHPELLAAGWQPAQVALPDLSDALGKGWKRDSGGTFGEFQVRNYLQLRVPGGDAAAAAAGWAGDRYDVYVQGDESLAVFRVQFRDEAAAARFEEVRADFLRRANAKQAGDTAAMPDGTVTTTLPRAGATVTFILASSQEGAQAARDVLAHG